MARKSLSMGVAWGDDLGSLRRCCTKGKTENGIG